MTQDDEDLPNPEAPKLNPMLVNGYLVYGDGRISGVGNGYEAWYWINKPVPQNPGEWEAVGGPARFGTEIYVTPALAAINGVSYGKMLAERMAPI